MASRKWRSCGVDFPTQFRRGRITLGSSTPRGTHREYHAIVVSSRSDPRRDGRSEGCRTVAPRRSAGPSATADHAVDDPVHGAIGPRGNTPALIKRAYLLTVEPICNSRCAKKRRIRPGRDKWKRYFRHFSSSLRGKARSFDDVRRDFALGRNGHAWGGGGMPPRSNASGDQSRQKDLNPTPYRFRHLTDRAAMGAGIRKNLRPFFDKSARDIFGN